MQKISQSLFFLSLLLIISLHFASAQSYNSIFLSETQINAADSNNVFFNFNNTNFIKNNEYFNKIIEGYTYIGLFAQPKLTYFPSKNIKIEGGVHLLKYSGLDKFTQTKPIFTFQYQHKDFSLILGTIYGTLNHNLPEPVFSFEHYYTNNVENGMQILLNKTYLKSDTWINWEQFILPNDTLPERLTFGSSNLFYLSDTSNSLILTIPLQFLINHRGGQSSNINSNIQTLANTDIGLNVKYKIQSKAIKSIEFNNYYFSFFNNSNIIETYFDKGSATYSQLIINANKFIYSVGYWNAHNFMSVFGDPMFQLVSQKNILDTKPDKQLLTSNLFYSAPLCKGVNFGFRTELYYDLAAEKFDYSMGLNIVVNQKFFLKKIKTYQAAKY
ncbi:MAG: hypothetical protein IMY72_05580 [Bacteroidetes bacterium]|nr:hypothetical protein [Bacteroidota bacterium]